MTVKQEYDRKRYAANPERFRTKTQEYKRLNREKVLLSKRISYHKNHPKQRERKLIQNYGITQAAFDDLLQSQGGSCAICRSTKWGANSPHVDHDHATGRVRGILCFRCNSVLGKVNDDLALLDAMKKYLISRRIS